MDVSSEIRRLVSLEGGKLPRRVALHQGRVLEFGNLLEQEECHVLSRICEILRQSRHEPVYSRQPLVLLRFCLAHDDEHAWLALCGDVQRGLVSEDELREYFDENPNEAAGFSQRFTSSRTALHATALVSVLAVCVVTFSRAACEAFASSLRHGRGRTLVQSYVTHAKTMPPTAREAMLDALGKTLIHAYAFQALLWDVFESLETPLCEDIFCVLMASPCIEDALDAVRATPRWDDIMGCLIDMAKKMPPPRRGGVLYILSRLAKEMPTDRYASELLQVALSSLVACPTAARIASSAAALTLAVSAHIPDAPTTSTTFTTFTTSTTSHSLVHALATSLLTHTEITEKK